MKNHLIIIFFFITLFAFGQEEIEKKKKLNSIIFSPFNLIDPINPSFQLGYERTINTKWALQLEGGYIINKGLINILLNPQESADEYSNKGYKLRFEIKRTLAIKDEYGFYISSEVHYLKNVSKVINQFVVSDPSYNYSFGSPPDNGEFYYDDYFTNGKSKYGINIKVGLKTFLDAIVFEGYVGLGVAYRNNIHSNRENINDDPLYDDFLNDNARGSKIILNIPLNLKVGYAF